MADLAEAEPPACDTVLLIDVLYQLPEAEQRMTWTERDTVRRRQYFEIRYANACESQSIDEEPAGFDPPVGVPCP